MSDPARANAHPPALAALGCRLSLDDFGTGYSSLAYLQRLPIHQLKIDRSFVLEMSRDCGAAVIVRSIIGLAHGLGLKVIAEGVETEQDLFALRELGCETVQGYLIGRPMAAEDFEDWLRTSPHASKTASAGNARVPAPSLPQPARLGPRPLRLIVPSGMPAAGGYDDGCPSEPACEPAWRRMP